MALITNIGAGIFTSLKFKADNNFTLPTNDTTHQTFISGSGDFNGNTEITNAREFPSFGKPANIVNVPNYGQSISSQIQGQADAPTMEFTVNYVPSVHGAIQALVQDGNTYVYQIDLKNAETGDNAAFYVKGQFASFEVSPNLTDSNQATITMSTQGDYVGPFAD
ncbi:hypothetical protein Aegir_gp22 [Pelagibacter phage Aegir EXVC013S]|nr:hypothetical protein Aegir_gp22 [Pelagibacter phage Aegir EXVC013S]QLF88451.1 hypothetical protein Kolga_gp5 [Pelagibacter phage Kolga EXVC016S]